MRQESELLLEVAKESSLEFADDDLDYVTIQMDKNTWSKLKYSEANYFKDRKSLKGVPDLRHGKKPEHSERMKQIYAEKRNKNAGLNRSK